MVLMWEVRTAGDRLDELVAHLDAHADPSAQIYLSQGEEPRVVVIDPSGHGIAQVPTHLMVRPPHTWEFQAVTRRSGPKPEG